MLRDVGADAGLLVRLLPELAAVAPAGADAGEADEALRFSLYGAVTRAVAALAERRPVVVVLDDVHWADAASLRLLRFLAPQVPSMRVLVVATFRDDEVAGELGDALATLARQDGVTRLELSGLSEGDVGRLLAGALDATPADPIVRDIAERSAGNPFFVGELARLLEGSGAVSSEDVPPGVRDVIRRRIERLPEGADRLLAAAAVVGREFDLAIAAEVADLDPDDDATLDLVDAAVGAHLLVEGARIGRYRFTHALVQDALRTGLSALRRARMHDRIAQVLASSARTGRAEDLAALAFHALVGADVGDASAALGYALDAAAAALAALSFEEAASLCSLALAVMDRTGAGDDTCRFVLLLDLGIARRRQGDVDGSRTALREALATARSLGDAERFAEAALAFGGGAWWGWWSDVGFADAEAVAAFEEALERSGPAPSARRAEVLGRLAVELHFDDAATARRDDLSAEALTMARGLDDRRALVHALAARHIAVWRAGNAGERRRARRRARRHGAHRPDARARGVRTPLPVRGGARARRHRRRRGRSWRRASGSSRRCHCRTSPRSSCGRARCWRRWPDGSPTPRSCRARRWRRRRCGARSNRSGRGRRSWRHCDGTRAGGWSWPSPCGT